MVEADGAAPDRGALRQGSGTAVLEEAHIKLASVVTDIRDVSARAMLEALIAGHRDVTALADLARGRLRTKRANSRRPCRGISPLIKASS
jgi:hypothetical protein